MSNLPAEVFNAALAEVEAAMPGLTGAMGEEGIVGAAANEMWTKMLREECARRGWVQRDVRDVKSWEFVGVSKSVPGSETVPSGEGAPQKE